MAYFEDPELTGKLCPDNLILNSKSSDYTLYIYVHCVL